MATKTFFLTNATLDIGVGTFPQEMSETSPGSDATSSPNLGWVVGTGSTNHSEFQAGSKRASTTFASTPVAPDGSINTTLADAWRSTGKLTGTFAAGNWVAHGVVIGVTNSGAQDGRISFRLLRSTSADGSGATEITSARQAGSLYTNLSTTQQDSSATFDPGSVTLTDEYLWLQIGCERTGAGGMSTTDVVFRVGTTASRITTPNFTPGTINLDPGGVAGAEAFGTAVIAVSITASSVAGAEAFGTAVEGQTIDSTGVATGEVHGSGTVEVTGPAGDNIDPSGISTGEAFGTAVEGQAVAPAGVAGAEAFGTATEGQTVAPAGVATGETIGSASLLPVVLLDPAGIASLQAFGSSSLAFTIIALGVAGAEAFGTAVEGLALTTSGVATGEAHGSGTVGNVSNIDPTGIASGELMGAPSLLFLITPTGLASGAAFGTAQLEGSEPLYVGFYNEISLYYTKETISVTQIHDDVESEPT